MYIWSLAGMTHDCGLEPGKHIVRLTVWVDKGLHVIQYITRKLLS